MTRHLKLKDGTIIEETQKGVFTLIFTNHRYMTITTWEGKVKVYEPSHGDFEMGDLKHA